MSEDTGTVRFSALIHAQLAPGSPNCVGVQQNFRSSVVVDGVYYPSQVMECSGTIAPGKSGSVTIEMIGAGVGVIAPEVHFELRSGPVVAAKGVVESVEFVRFQIS